MELTKYDAMRTALIQAHRIDDVKDIRDKAEALRQYARQAGESLDNQNMMAEIKLRAERRCGELLGDMERHSPEDGRPKVYHDDTHIEVNPSPPTLADLNISRVQSSRWQAIAAVPESVFERHIANIKAEAQELTTASVLRVAQQIKREQYHEAMREAPPMPDDKFRVWYADPPWQYNDSGVITDSDNYGRAERHYPTMSTADLCEMGRNVRERCADDAVLFLWATSPLLEDALAVIKAWGFQYKNSFVLAKVEQTYGASINVRHEFLLIATRGSCLPDERTLYDSVVSIPKSDVHSQKPEEFRRMIDSLYTWGRRIELFARESVESWDTWGNQA